MIRDKLETYVVEEFGMSLSDFIKYQIKVNSLLDYEIAKILKVDTTMIRCLRKDYGISKGNSFEKRFEQNYGRQSLEKFKMLVENPDYSLSYVAREFGFSRQYAWQVYKKIFGFPYSDAYKIKRKEREKKRLIKWHNSKRLDSLMKVKEKIESLGLNSQIAKKGAGYLLVTKGYKLVSKCTSSPRVSGTKQYFYISNVKGYNRSDYDFFIGLCISPNERTFFVIPHDLMPKNGVSLMPHAGLKESKYTQFKEAWHLLARN